MGVHATSYIKTEATAVVRNADILSYQSAGNIDSTKGSMSAEFTTEWTDAITSYCQIVDGGGYWFINQSDRSMKLYDSVNYKGFKVVTGLNTIQKIASHYGDSLMNTFYNGSNGVEGTFDNDMNFGATLYIGNCSDGARGLNGTLKNLKIWKRKLSSNLMIGETTL